MQTFFEAYIECALWSSTCNHPDAPDSDASFDSAGYSVDDIAPVALETMKKDCEDFIILAGPMIDDAEMSAEQAGHDFWLTRNGHGAGFWDRGLGEIGDKLTEMAHPYGSCDLYLGDDNLIYCQ